jgi:hypothetical protein
MEDVLASKVWSAEVLLALSEGMQALACPVDARYPSAGGASEQDLPGLQNGEERIREERRHDWAAYWL